MDRKTPVEIIRFYSARKAKAKNVAIAEPKAIRSKQPRELRTWLCLTNWDMDNPNSSSVSFRSRESAEVYEFRRADFCDQNGQFLIVV